MTVEISDVKVLLAEQSKIAKGQEPVEVYGFKFNLDPQVLAPTLSRSGAFMANHLIADQNFSLKGKRVLDLGCGSGVIGLHCLRAGAEHVTFSDINRAAVVNAQKNVNSNGFLDYSRVALFMADGFPNKAHKYDIIVCNAPFWDHATQAGIEQAAFDPAHQFSEKVLQSAGAHLSPGGRLYYGISSQANLETIERLLEQSPLTQIGYHEQLSRSADASASPHTRMMWVLQHTR